MSELILDPNRIKDEIAWLEDDVLVCRAAMRTAPVEERCEYSSRISANLVEIAKLKEKIRKER